MTVELEAAARALKQADDDYVRLYDLAIKAQNEADAAATALSMARKAYDREQRAWMETL